MDGAIQFGPRRLSAGGLRSRALRAAAGLRSLGLHREGAVALVLRNDLAFFEATTGCRLAGACVVPVNWHLTATELAYVLHDCDARVLVVHADLLEPALAAAPPGCRVLVVDTPAEVRATYRLQAPDLSSPPAGSESWDDWLEAQPSLPAPAEPAGSYMLYTSGTTGHPKGVLRRALAPRAQEAYYASVTHAFGLRRGMRALVTGPLYHSSPYAHAHVGLWLEAEQWLMARFDPETLLALVQQHRITHMHVVPTMFVRLLRLPEDVRARYDVSSLECVAHGAAPCPEAVKRRMLQWWGPVIREYYGSTEASVLTAVDSADWLAHPGTVGRARPGVTLAIRSDDGRSLAPGEEGEIWGRLDSAPPFEYHRRPRDRAAIERDGLITNGDVGVLDGDGWLYVRDRKRDMIISGGVNIYPAEIEGALMEHPQVADCAVFGIPDDEFGEAVAAAVQPAPGTQPQPTELASFLEQRLARFKVPRTIEVRESLPRGENGKIYKRRLREPYWHTAGRRI
jgi:long-chain acyl-CoA synthetase